MSSQISAGKKAGFRFGHFLKNNGYVMLAFFAAGFLMLFVWFCFQVIPFGSVPEEFAGEGLSLLERLRHGRTLLRMDAFHQYGPLFGEYYERLTEGRSLLYSWNTGLGGNFLGNLFNYLASPFGLLVVIFGHARVPEAFGVMILLKAATASGAFAYMLRKMFKRNDASIAAFGVLYAFCGFFIAYYWNVMWIDAMVLLPLVALGIDRIVKHQRFGLYAVSLALTLVSNYYMGYMVCIFSVLFFLLRYFSEHDFKSRVEEKAPKVRRGLLPGRFGSIALPGRNSRLLRSGGAFALGSVMAGALAAFALVPVFFALRSSSATSGDFPEQSEWFNSAFSIFDFLANHLADVTPTIRSSGEDVLPNIYCGVATLVLLPLYFFVPSIKVREKALNAGLLALLFFSFNTRVLNFIWHANHFPNDLPYRFSFLYSFLLLLIAFRTFQHIRELSGKQILASGMGLTVFVVLVQVLGSKNVTGGGRATSEADLAVYLNIAFAAVYTVLLFAMARSPRSRANALSLLMLCAVVTEVCAADTNNFEISQEKYPFAYDLASFETARDRIEEEDGSFYRMELTDLRTRMDPAWYDYPGISTFSSMAYEKTSNLQYRLGLGSNFINSYTYNPQTPVYNAMHSLKYLFENQENSAVLRTYKGVPYSGSGYAAALDSPYYTYLFSEQRFMVYENNYWLPIGYFAKDALRSWKTTTNANPFELQADYWYLASGASDVFLPLTFTAVNEDFDAEYPYVTVDSESQYVSYSGATSTGTKGRRIPLEIHVEQTQNAYIHVNTSNVKAVKVYREGGGIEDRSHDDRCIWDLGVVTPGDPLRVELALDADAPDSGGFSCYVYTLNDAAFMEGYNFFSDYSWQIADDGHSDTMLTGTITAPPGEDGLLYTSIPYDEGWQVTVDGKRVPLKDYVAVGDGAFLAVPLEGGAEHTVTMKFVPRGLRTGLLITGATLVLLGLWGFLLELRKNKAAKELPLPAEGNDDPPPPPSDAYQPPDEPPPPPPSPPPPAPYVPSGRFPVDYPAAREPEPQKPPGGTPLFSTAGLRPEDFSLNLNDPVPEERFRLSLPDPDAPVKPLVAELPPEEPEAAEPPEPAEEAESPLEEEQAAEITEEQPPEEEEKPSAEEKEEPSEDAEYMSKEVKDITALLQELSEHAAALEQRVIPKPKPEGDSGGGFRFE